MILWGLDFIKLIQSTLESPFMRIPRMNVLLRAPFWIWALKKSTNCAEEIRNRYFPI